MTRGIVAICAPFLLISTIAQAEPLPSVSPKSVEMSSDRLGRIVPIMQGYVDAGEVSGITTAVMRHGKILHMESVGLRDIERKLPMTRDTIFRIYSMSKPITSVAVMMLYEEGKFELTDPISDYLPQFKDMQVYVSGTVDSLKLEAADPVPTIHDLIRHRCLVPRCDGVSYCDLPSKEILWDNYSTAAPERQRRFVAQYNIVKRV